MEKQLNGIEYGKILIEGYIEDYYRTTGKKLIAYEQRKYFKEKKEIVLNPVLDEIYQLTKEVFRIDCLKETKEQEYVQVRTILYQTAKDRGCTYTSIAKFVHKDHTSIPYALNSKTTTYPEYKEKLDKFRKQLEKQNG